MSFPTKNVLFFDMVTNFFLKGFRRLKVQTLTLIQDFIVDGAGASIEWINTSIAAGGKVYAEFEIPAGFYVAIDSREVVTDKDRLFYRVYTTYGAVTNVSAVPINRLRNDGPLFPQMMYVTTAPGVAPDPTTAILTVPVFGAEGAGNRLSGDVSSESVFRLLAPGSKFLLEISNDSIEACYAQLNLVIGLIPANLVRPLN